MESSLPATNKWGQHKEYLEKWPTSVAELVDELCKNLDVDKKQEIHNLKQSIERVESAYSRSPPTPPFRIARNQEYGKMPIAKTLLTQEERCRQEILGKLETITKEIEESKKTCTICLKFIEDMSTQATLQQTTISPLTASAAKVQEVIQSLESHFAVFQDSVPIWKGICATILVKEKQLLAHIHAINEIALGGQQSVAPNDTVEHESTSKEETIANRLEGHINDLSLDPKRMRSSSMSSKSGKEANIEARLAEQTKSLSLTTSRMRSHSVSSKNASILSGTRNDGRVQIVVSSSSPTARRKIENMFKKPSK